MTSPSSVIGRQVLEIEIEHLPDSDAFIVQQEVRDHFQTAVVPAMAEAFDRCVPADTVLRLDRLTLDVGRIPRAQLGELFASRVCQALEDELIVGHEPLASQSFGGTERLSHADRVLELWHYTLQHGRLPWWASPPDADKLESDVVEALGSRRSLPPATTQLLRSHDVALRRIALHGSEQLFERVLNLLSADLARLVVPALQLLLLLLEESAVDRVQPTRLRAEISLSALEEATRANSTDPLLRLRTLLTNGLDAAARVASSPTADLRRELSSRLEKSRSGIGPVCPAPVREVIAEVLYVDRVSSRLDEERPERAILGADLPDEEKRFRRSNKTQLDSAPTMSAPAEEPRRSTRSDATGDAFPHAGLRGERSDLEEQGRATSLPDTDQAQEGSPLADGQTNYVDDAGMVLLHPFLTAHFKKLGLQRDGNFVNEEARERAVHQLRFLATGQEDATEPLLVLAKILCGMEPSAPVGRSAGLDELARTQAATLMEAVIRHWAALKNTTPEGLRETFLRREGRLEKIEDGWRLRVDARGFDVLLARLPWPLSVIRLPWMSETLFVEWG